MRQKPLTRVRGVCPKCSIYPSVFLENHFFVCSYCFPYSFCAFSKIRKGDEGAYGVICFEHIGKPRIWTADDQEFATSIASIVSLMVESTQRKVAENKIVKANKQLTEANKELSSLRIQLENENVYLRNELDLVFNYEEMVYGSAAFSDVLNDVEKVAPTNATVLLLGESGTGKELLARAIHNISSRNKKPLIKVNCAAIPSELIESELFGHEKGSFTGASGSRKGYFEVADGGTIFLDEVAELPMQTQVRLLRVLETGEFIRVGSSKSIKTNVRVVAATNENMQRAISSGKFREDLFYRLSTVPISLPSLRNRKEDVHLLFRKFASDFSDKYRMPAIKLNEDAVELLNNYSWPGNIRQLKNLVEQISVIETSREIDAVLFKRYLPDEKSNAPAIIPEGGGSESINERELMYKFLFDMKKDLTDLKKIVLEMVSQNGEIDLDHDQTSMINRFYSDVQTPSNTTKILPPAKPNDETDFDFDSKNNDSSNEEHEEVEESLSLEDREKELIQKALEKHKGKRKYAASELGISERTLYRKIKEYNLAD